MLKLTGFLQDFQERSPGHYLRPESDRRMNQRRGHPEPHWRVGCGNCSSVETIQVVFGFRKRRVARHQQMQPAGCLLGRSPALSSETGLTARTPFKFPNLCDNPCEAMCSHRRYWLLFLFQGRILLSHLPDRRHCLVGRVR